MRAAWILITLLFTLSTTMLSRETGAEFNVAGICSGEAPQQASWNANTSTTFQKLKRLADRSEAQDQAWPQPKLPACTTNEQRFGYRGYMHCAYHDMYQIAFQKWNCKCYTGQCRPTKFRYVPKTEKNPTGIEGYLGGHFYPIPPDALRRERIELPDKNMQREFYKWDAHGCANDDPAIATEQNPHIECFWIKEDGT